MSLYNIEVGCGGGIRMIYPTPKDYKWTVATGIHTYIVEAHDARDALIVLDSQPKSEGFCCGGNWIWENCPEPMTYKSKPVLPYPEPLPFMIVPVSHPTPGGSEMIQKLLEDYQDE